MFVFLLVRCGSQKSCSSAWVLTVRYLAVVGCPRDFDERRVLYSRGMLVGGSLSLLVKRLLYLSVNLGFSIWDV
jgi:hypothetical protein